MSAHLKHIRGGQPVPKSNSQSAPKSSAPPIRPRPEPGRYPFCKGVPVDLLRQFVELALWKQGATGEPFTWEAAVADYMLETDNGRDECYSLEDRAARWGWALSKSSMSGRMKAIREDAEDWAEMYRSKRGADRSAERSADREASRTPAERQPNAPERQPNENGPDEQESQGEPNADERQPNASRTPAERGTLIYARDITHNSNLDDDEADDRARARLDFIVEDKRGVYRPAIEDLLDRYSPSSLDMMLRYAWGRDASGTGITNVLAQFRAQEALHGTDAAFERVAAAVVIANLAEKPNELYTSRVLEAFDDPDRHRGSGRRGSRSEARRPASATPGESGDASLDALVRS